MTYREPPEGWYPFGTHMEDPRPLKFSEETDEADMPLWEKPVKSLRQMQAEGRAYSEAHGWYDIPRTWGEEMALLHSEASEALDAFRLWGLDDKTKPQVRGCRTPERTRPDGGRYVECVHGQEWNTCTAESPLEKPEGVGSELADVLIRLLDTCERHGFDIERGGQEVGWSQRVYDPNTPFGDMINDLHAQIQKWNKMKTDTHAALVYTLLKSICAATGISLEDEYERKYAFNLTRPYRHGNKRL